jgi:hypothetical protein
MEQRSVHARYIKAIKPVGLLTGFDKAKGVDTIHRQLDGNFIVDSLTSFRAASLPIHAKLAESKQAAEDARRKQAGAYVLGYCLGLRILTDQGIMRDVSPTTLRAFYIYKQWESMNGRNPAVELASRQENLRGQSKDLEETIEHLAGHLPEELPASEVWNGVTDVFLLALFQATEDNIVRVESSN